MMPHFPYLGMPYYNRYSRYGYGYHYPYYSYKKTKENFSNNNSINNTTHEINGRYKYEVKNDKSKNNQINETENNVRQNGVNNEQSNDQNNDKPLFQFFGINLYFDDILLICLIWFLYDEGVKDEGLFIALILLLLS